MVLSLCIISTNLLTSELRSSRPGRRSFADVHMPSNLTFIEKDLIGGGVPEKAEAPKGTVCGDTLSARAILTTSSSVC